MVRLQVAQDERSIVSVVSRSWPSMTSASGLNSSSLREHDASEEVRREVGDLSAALTHEHEKI